jgi:hypothetical protein
MTMADRFNMSDVMISYARRDKAFVEKLEQALREDGLETWVDWQDIPATADWWAEVEAGIEAAHTFVFVITPASVHSEVCTRELNHAVQHHKRLVPILHEMLSEADNAALHPALKVHNWLYFRDSDHFRRAYLALRATLETDLEQKKLHTRLLVRAREWQEQGSASLLLRGDDLREAERWLERALSGATPQPTPTQMDYIRRSRQAVGRRQRTLLTGSMGVLALFSFLLLVALGQSQRAGEQAQTAVQEINLRATQEKAILDSLAAAATAKAVEAQSNLAASTAQQGMAAAQTSAAQSFVNSQNSQTQAYIAQQNALTATVQQGQAQAQAVSAQVQQTQAGSSAVQAQQQAQVAQQQAAEAGTQSALFGTQGAQAATAVVTIIAAAQQKQADAVTQAAQAATNVANAATQVAQDATAYPGTPTAQYNAIMAIMLQVATAQEDTNKMQATAHKFSDDANEAAHDALIDYYSQQGAATNAFYSHQYAREVKEFGFDGVLQKLTDKSLNELRAACLSAESLSPEAQAICERVRSIPTLTFTPTPTPYPPQPSATFVPSDTPAETETPSETLTATETPIETLTPTLTETPPEALAGNDSGATEAVPDGGS